MKYDIEVNNWYEDFYHEEQILCSFDSLSDAISFISSDEFKSKTKVFDVTGEIRWYFPSCDENGVIVNPDEFDVIECYQLVSINTEDKSEETAQFLNGSFPVVKCYTLDYSGHYNWL